MIRKLRRAPGYLFASIWVIAVFVIIIWIILASLSTTKEIFKGELISGGLQFSNYKKALFTNKLIINLMNSVIYTVPSCILVIGVCAPAAYCLSRFNFRGNQTFQKMILAGLSIPGIMIIMPLCTVFGRLNISGHRYTMILLYTATAIPYTTYFLMTFFKGISNTYAEAATIDGCGQVRTFWEIMFPLAQTLMVSPLREGFRSRSAPLYPCSFAAETIPSQRSLICGKSSFEDTPSRTERSSGCAILE